MTVSDVFRKIAKGWLVLGLMVLAFAAIFATSHYIFGVPVHEGHGERVASPSSVAETLLVLASGAAFFVVAAILVLVRLKKT